ncbi:MAG: IS21 family transposase [Myxococcaceae bacterium]
MPPDEKLIHDVVRLANEGMKRRAIARALHISRNTVRKVLAAHGEARATSHSALARPRTWTRPSKLDVFRPRVDELLGQYKDITAQRVFEILCEDGFDGGYTGVKDLVRRIRPKPTPKPSLETPPRVPGDMGECDWSPYDVAFTHAPPATLQAFGYTLRYSTRKYYGFHEGNGLHPLMDGHVHAFERFKGAARRCKYDNQKPVVLRWEGGQPIYNLRFIDFATFYEFSPVACHPRSPNEKPRVERSFYELTLSFFRGRSFRDFADLQAQLTHWMDTIADARPIKRMKRRTRMELFAEEQSLLRPLPRHPYDTARVLYRVCDIEGFIAWEGNWYSLPYDYVTDILPVRITETELFVYKADLTCIARHPLLPRGAQLQSVLEGHRPRHADRGPDLDQLRGAFAGMDEKAAAFLGALEKAQPRSAGYHARRILALRGGWDTADLVAALEHALAYGALEHQSVERILLVRGTPRRLDEYVAQASAQKLDPTHACAQPRDLAEYDALPTQGALPPPTGAPECPSEQSTEPKPVPSNLEEPPKTSSGNESSGT